MSDHETAKLGSGTARSGAASAMFPRVQCSITGSDGQVCVASLVIIWIAHDCHMQPKILHIFCLAECAAQPSSQEESPASAEVFIEFFTNEHGNVKAARLSYSSEG
ncbi:hypothetical protein N7491_000459 [Penicillium cf. griseofulvum]|uniref:Uncharacterized protein n=1 Tax=Penicillium cf. griseofulvum TaxID=2972120 RepID=A0A9W9JM69_9EURO|nr:hypothetical protein N7472_004181 [Penicillium cf. griseofulvum]KAJ5443271.1 hypothetical protein N7445_004384 [Penicillium cf. griseofulvum]KAJ5451277.1 hypothetical protein N7491_000459 [Penicillium cf. griseofulvum]